MCREAVWSPAAFDLFKCARCSLLVGPQLWRRGDLAQANAEAFGSQFVDRVDAWQALFEIIRNRRVWRRLCPHLGPGDSLLEIGVGSGSFLAHARRRGLTVLGCDMSAAVCEHVTRQHGVTMTHGDVWSLPQRVRFDAVVMTHVLEHAPDPIDMLSRVRKAMPPSSVLYVAVPNAGCWEAALPGWVGYQPYHLSYFTRNSLARALRASGFSPIGLETVEPFSGWSIALRRSLSRAPTSASQPASSSTGVGRHLQCAIAGGVGLATAPLRYLQARLGFGEELIALAVPAPERRT